MVNLSKLENIPNYGSEKPIINSVSITTNNDNGTLQSNNLRINISNVTAKWIQDEIENSLRRINLTVKTGQLVAVIGPVGAGKVYIIIINHYIFNNSIPIGLT